MSAGTVLGDPARLAAVARTLAVAQASRESWDRLAELAATVMGTPIGMVNLIDLQQHLVGLVGLGEPFSTSRTASVDIGFCPRTLFAGNPLFIEDVAAQPEFADHPGYHDRGFAAYAGCPLRDAEGQLIGTLCTVDTRPHRWREADRRALEILATSVVNELRLYQDIDRRQGLLDAFTAAPAAIAVTRGPRHIVEYLNTAYRSMIGDLPLGVPARQAMPQLPENFHTLMDQVLASGEEFRTTGAPVTMVWPEQEPRERFFDFSYSAIRRRPGDGVDHRGLLVVAVEVTEQMHSRREWELRARRQELLARASAALNRSLDPAAELQELARAVVPDLADLSTVHRLACPLAPGTEPPLPVITDRVAIAGAPGLSFPRKSRRLRWDGANDPIPAAIRRGELVRQPVPTAVPSWAYTTGSADTFRGGLRHVVVAPVIVDGLVVAVVSFLRHENRPPWSDDDLHALGQITRYAGIALDHGMTYQATRASALVLQRSLLTDPPTVPGLQICARYRPAGRDEVGGDWYDAFRGGPQQGPQQSQDQLAVVIGDVVGHDITAAAAMGHLRASLRGLVLDRCEGPAAILDRLAAINSRLAITPFATLLYANLTRHGDRWTMCWASAGHPPPLLITAGHARLLERVGGSALIPTQTPPRAEAEIVLPAGSILVFYTDGLVERRGSDLDSNLDALAIRATAGPDRIEPLCDHLLADAPTSDDIAILALRVCTG